MSKASKRFVALDRDGTIIVEREYLADPKGVELLPGSLAGLKKMRQLGLGLIVVSNQSGIGRGYFDLNALEAVNAEMKRQLSAGGVKLDGIYFCPHLPEDDCICRKPRPGLLARAAHELGFDIAQMFVVGDKACDVDLGRGVGATSLLVRTGYGAGLSQEEAARADYIVNNLEEAADVIGRLVGGNGMG